MWCLTLSWRDTSVNLPDNTKKRRAKRERQSSLIRILAWGITTLPSTGLISVARMKQRTRFNLQPGVGWMRMRPSCSCTKFAFVQEDHTEMDREAARARERSGGETWISSREASALAYSGWLPRHQNGLPRPSRRRSSETPSYRCQMPDAGRSSKH